MDEIKGLFVARNCNCSIVAIACWLKSCVWVCVVESNCCSWTAQRGLHAAVGTTSKLVVVPTTIVGEGSIHPLIKNSK